MEEQAIVVNEEAQEPEKPSKDLLERTWDFFASVPVATVLIFIIAVASVAGTLIEQEGQYSDWRPPTDFYPARYGAFWGNFLFKTGMTRMYGSWWFLTLLFMLGASLVVCSLERFIPLWRAVQRPAIKPPEGYVKHLKQRFAYKPVAGVEPLAPLAAALKSRRYKVVVEGDRLYADKGRWGRWGPYVTHIGLLLILVGAMMRAIPGFYSDQYIEVRDGEVAKVPGADWYVRNDKFTLETYADTGMPKAYITEATIIEGGNEVDHATITMNHPLSHRWIELYQSSYKQEMGTATLTLLERASGKALGSFDLDLINPAQQYKAGDYTVKIREYYPDFAIENNKPVSRSSQVVNPGVQMDIITPDGKSYAVWYFVAYPDMEFDPTTPVKLNTISLGETFTTGLKVKRDLGIPVIYLGLIIVSLGVFATFYIAHKRYWALVDGGSVAVGAWTNRNQGSLQSEMGRMATLLDPKTNPETDRTEGEER